MGIQSGIKKMSHLSTAGKVIFIISIFVLISIELVVIIYMQGRVFDGVRSYIRAEGLWAKAQKDAVLSLERYSYTRDESDYLAFEKAIEVNIGDRRARNALYESPPDRDEAAKGALQGGNDPRDIDSLIWFFLNFQNVSYMHDAIEIWKSADAKIDELRAVGKAMRAEISAPQSRPGEMVLLRGRLQELDIELQALENLFSIVLGEGARWVKKTTWLVSVAVLLFFVGIAVFVSRQIIRSIIRSERELLVSESRFRSLKESDTIGIVSWRTDGRIDEANKSFLEMLGYTESDVENGTLDWIELTPVQQRAKDLQAIEELLANGRCEPFEKVFVHKKGYLVPVYVGASMLSDERNYSIAFVVDLSEREKAEEQLRLASTVFAASYDGILITDPSMRIVSVNQALCSMTGYDEEELKGRVPNVMESGSDEKEIYRDMQMSIEEKGHWEGDVVDRMKNGEPLPVRASISSVRNSEGKVTHYVIILSDITERKAREEHLRHVAHHDMLTGLPNRVLFNDRIVHAVEYAARSGTRLAVLFFDLDNFKPVNDRFGHKVGDRLLKIVADRMRKNVRAMDTVARLGGDEFVILLQNAPDNETVDRILNKIVDAVRTPCRIEGHEIDISVSYGVSIYPDDSTDAESLLHHADIDMYGMKQGEGKRR
jgi:diguanylate cyclase (GGDEF)-like protein/PAS domain S-box-containing protein